MRGRLVPQLQERGRRGDAACWVVTFVDGLLYREALFGSIVEARRAYGRLGIELGIAASEPVLPEAV